jgi:hypothetical protein
MMSNISQSESNYILKEIGEYKTKFRLYIT